MLSKEARTLIFDAQKAYRERKEDIPPLSREEIRKRDYDNCLAQSAQYAHTSVSVQDFFGTPVDVMIPDKIERKDVMFFIHGGAWAFGSSMQARLVVCGYTEKHKGIALCPSYRYAPENKFSVLVEDCYHAYLAAAEKYGAKNIILSGSSAGGNLALAVMQRLREENKDYPKCLVLYSPATFFDEKKDSAICLQDWDFVLRDFSDSQIIPYGDDKDYYKNKYMSPLYGEYDGFPPMYIACGSEEKLLDDSFLLFKKAKKSGVKAVLSVRAGMWHSYPECQTFIPEGQEEIENALSFVDDVDEGKLTL